MSNVIKFPQDDDREWHEFIAREVDRLVKGGVPEADAKEAFNIVLPELKEFRKVVRPIEVTLDFRGDDVDEAARVYAGDVAQRAVTATVAKIMREFWRMRLKKELLELGVEVEYLPPDEPERGS